jgi:isocitrate dehydrogenase (NAD+)
VAHRVTLIPGDGTGPELVAAAQRVLEAAGAELEWDVQQVGTVAAAHGGNPLPGAVLDSIRENGVALKGPVSTLRGTGFRSVNIALRRSLDLFAQVRVCRSFPGVPSPCGDLDLIVMRETTEDLYAGIEYEAGSADGGSLVEWLAAHDHPGLPADSALSIKPISPAASCRIFEFAFDYARRNGRRKLTAVHKATVMKFSDGLFLQKGREAAAANPDVEFDEWAVDSLALQLVRRPEDFDLLVAPNLYGDILADLGAGLIGGIGLVPGANYGDDAAVFEAAHGSAPKYAGQNKVNPTAMVLCGAMLLRHLGEHSAADRVEAATRAVIAEGTHVTYDLRPQRDDPRAAGTAEVADAIIERMRHG